MANTLLDQMKTCNQCGETKPLEMFSRHSTTRDKVRTYCKSCSTKMAQRYYRNNPAKMLANRLKRKYNITFEHYEILLIKQNNACAICETAFGLERVNFPCVDHDHVTLKVRGLLCFNCNTVLGKVKDDLIILRNAIKYLETTNE